MLRVCVWKMKERTGVPPDALMPLTKVEAGQLATQWAALPAEQRPAFLHELQAYGAYAPQVMKQVGISVMEQDMAFSMLNDPQNVGGAKAVFSTMSLDEKDVPKIEVKDALAEFMEESDVYQVYLRQAQATNSPELWKTVKDYEQAATRLLKTGKSVEDVKRILNAGRERLTGDNMAVLVPASRSEGWKNACNAPWENGWKPLSGRACPTPRLRGKGRASAHTQYGYFRQ